MDLEKATQGLVATYGMWGESPNYPVADWKYEVANDGTRLGYWTWVAAKVQG